MKIATFNINGVKARIDGLTTWLADSAPDVAVLQEIKSVDAGFPRQALEDLGYNVETHGQKGFNGVVGQKALRICGLYLPNGNPAPGPKYDYKLAWMDRLFARAQDLLSHEEPALMCGDYNIIPQPQDAARPDAWADDALFRPQSRAAFRRILNLGYTEAFRARQTEAGHYSFWDYQAGAWDRNDGIRIDHFLLTPQCADLLRDCWIEKDLRGREKPSDHVPVWVDLAL